MDERSALAGFTRHGLCREETGFGWQADGLSRLELSRFLAPPALADHRRTPVNAPGYPRVMFTVEDIDDTLARLGKRGAELVGKIAQYENTCRLCYIRGLEGNLIGLAQALGHRA